jgi:anti-sigma factor RsiW
MSRCEEIVPLLGPLYDGALADDDRAWAEDHVCGCPSCRDRLALIAALAEAVRESVVDRARALDLNGLPDRVMARVRSERPRPAERATVWGHEMWWVHRRALAAAGGLAVAACVALAVLFLPSPADDSGLIAESSPQIEEVDFGTHSGAVLQLPRQTTVIWLSDDRGVPQ